MLHIRPFVVALLLVCASTLGACVPARPSAGQPERSLTFMAGFKPQANLPFVAAYLAQERGLFRQQGLAVEIKHSAGQGEHYQLLAARRIDVTTAPAEDVLKLAEDPGLPFVAVALIGQRGDRGFAVLAESEVRMPKDGEGRTVGYKVLQTPDYLAILQANGVDRSKIREVPVGFDPRLLAERVVDVYPVFLANEPDTLRRLGVETRVFSADQYGVPSLGLTYVVHRDLLRDDPAAVERFLKATLRGLAEAAERPEEAIDVVMRYAPGEDRPHQRAMFDVERANATSELTARHGLGWMTEGQWQALHDVLLRFGALKAPRDVRESFSDRPLAAIYRDGALRWP
jgi:ABC-type nitrate/sulfonate/bicarbonate transport system substrate-binding protein